MSNFKQALVSYIDDKSIVKATFFFKSSNAFWIGVTGLKVPLQLTDHIQKISFTKSISINNVISADIVISNSSTIKIALKKSVFRSFLYQRMRESEITIDDTIFNILDNDRIQNLKLSFSSDSLAISYLKGSSNYYINLLELKKKE